MRKFRYANLLSSLLYKISFQDLLAAAPFTAVIPKPPAKTVQEQEKQLAKLEEKYSRIHLVSVIERLGLDPVSWTDFC